MALVFKVKFQDSLRRWVATEALNPDSFPITFTQLEAKIKELFHLSPSASLAITYVDNDNDVVTLADDQDLIDACIVQRLNPLRLDVQVLGDISSSSEVAQELPRSSDPTKFVDNVNIEAFLNTLFPQATADALKGFLHTYTPFIDPKLPAAACLAKVENAFKEFLNGFTAQHHARTKFTERSAPQHRNKHPCPAMSIPHWGDATFHWGIQCDGCGMSPIEGFRYKSTKETDYDLCASCFKAIGNDGDYEKLDRPVYHHPHSHHRPHCFKRGPRPFPAPPGCRASFARGPYGWKPNHHPFAVAAGCSASDEHKKLDARFVKDVTIFDGTELAPGSKFTKIWRMSNIGTLAWPQSTQLVHIGGDVLCPQETVALELPEGGLPCGEEVEVSVDLTAPEKAGRYVSHWRLTAPSGQKFGHRVWVVIQVVPEGEHSPQLQASLRNDESSVEVNKEAMDPQEAMDVDLDGTKTLIVDVDVNGGTKVVDVDLNGANTVVVDVVVNGETAVIEQLTVEKPPHEDHDNAHPTIVYPDPLPRGFKDVNISVEKSMEVGADTLVVYPDPTSYDLQDVDMMSREQPLEGGASRKNEVDGFSLVEKPTETTDWIELENNESFHTPERPKEDEDMREESLLLTMESMGFADRNVNISVLQKCNFVLQDAVDDLLAAAGWDGALKDLEEMGFVERGTNVRLLVKNKGSLKQTVRELVKLEKMEMEG